MTNKAESNNIEIDFKKVAEQINAKIKEAAAVMKEVNDLAKEAGLDGQIGYEYWDDDKELTLAQQEAVDAINIRPLFRELDQAGWATSSIGC